MPTQDEHAQTALDFLDKADRHYAEGDQIQASEKLWGAAQAVMAVSIQRGWAHTGNPAMKRAAERLAEEYGDPQIADRFAVAEKYHRGLLPHFHGGRGVDHRTGPRSTIWWRGCWRCVATAGGMGSNRDRELKARIREEFVEKLANRVNFHELTL